MKKLPILLIAALALTLNACGGGGGGSKDTENEPDLRILQKADLEALNATDSTDLRKFDDENYGVLTKVFGGTKGSDLLGYFRTRVSHSFNSYEMKSARLTVASEVSSIPVSAEDEKLTIAAKNMGTAYWYASAVEKKKMVLLVGDERIPIDSTRVGIIEFGPAYRKYVPDSTVEFPPEFRNMILLHEARHSDCTGGITETDLDYIRANDGPEQFGSGFKKHKCGHIHQTCPSNHTYKGKPVCDLHPWGAYAIGAIYARAMLPKYIGTRYARFLRAQAIDQAERAVGDLDKMIKGGYGEPDMSSSGVTGP